MSFFGLFSSLAKGIVPPSGGGTENFLRADGSWAAPPAAGAPSWSDVSSKPTTISGFGITDFAANTASALNASGSAPIYAARAWVNFNGKNTVTVRGSGNVSSITDNGTGDYTVNFATALPDENYVCNVSAKENDGTASSGVFGSFALQTVANTYMAGSVRVASRTTSYYDAAVMNVSIIR